jgi:hypothetical protein
VVALEEAVGFLVGIVEAVAIGIAKAIAVSIVDAKAFAVSITTCVNTLPSHDERYSDIIVIRCVIVLTSLLLFD